VTPQARIAVWVVAILAALSIAFSVALFLLTPAGPRAAARTSAEPKWKTAVAKAERIQEAKRLLLENGTVTKIDCAAHEVQMDLAPWRLISVDMKRKTVETLSALCREETGYSRITVVDNRSGRSLAEYSGYSEIRLF
jgi:hypothetical protein